MEETTPTYWQQTQRPLPSLVFVVPLLVLYETGFLWVGDGTSALYRNGVDIWMRENLKLEQFGVPHAYFLPLLPICIIAIFTFWQVYSKDPWRFDGNVIVGMLTESFVLAVALLVIGSFKEMAFSKLEASGIAAAMLVPSRTMVDFIRYIGAGIYEETLFRLILIPLVYCFSRAIGVPSVIGTTLALSLSAVSFSVNHFGPLAGPMIEPFSFDPFISHWVAGLFFAGIFVTRGFGIAVGTHVVYDVLVGVFQLEL